jgi:hypothetical protein
MRTNLTTGRRAGRPTKNSDHYVRRAINLTVDAPTAAQLGELAAAQARSRSDVIADLIHAAHDRLRRASAQNASGNIDRGLRKYLNRPGVIGWFRARIEEQYDRVLIAQSYLGAKNGEPVAALVWATAWRATECACPPRRRASVRVAFAPNHLPRVDAAPCEHVAEELALLFGRIQPYGLAVHDPAAREPWGEFRLTLTAESLTADEHAAGLRALIWPNGREP